MGFKLILGFVAVAAASAAVEPAAVRSIALQTALPPGTAVAVAAVASVAAATHLRTPTILGPWDRDRDRDREGLLLSFGAKIL